MRSLKHFRAVGKLFLCVVWYRPGARPVPDAFGCGGIHVAAFRWRAAERRHPACRERTGSPTLQPLQDPILPLPWIRFRGGATRSQGLTDEPDVGARWSVQSQPVRGVGCRTGDGDGHHGVVLQRAGAAQLQRPPGHRPAARLRRRAVLRRRLAQPSCSLSPQPVD
jgi:hypothetical protein